MNGYLRLSAALLVLNTSSTVLASTASDMTVSGLVTPSSCTVGLSGSGLIDHGKIPVHRLNLDTPTTLPSEWLDVDINCSGPMLFALIGMDSRADSSPTPDTDYGLGKNPHATSEHLGWVGLAFESALGDGQAMRALVSKNQGSNWVPQSEIHPKTLMGFARPGRPFPEPIVSLTTRIRADTTIQPANRLSLKQEVPLDGSLVLDLRYL
ncbi:DUF1120 domain-containing protein [uncultured Pseudomonas sp.]|uniref:DUF1120 domain-containing protein n=1 Tax=uncultured Pseudomonas sp. TaxID=114707 RepID=UPI0025DB2D12|nr:DUF1120 domain-containing protein [uncultured Pseudomonas sp.]